MTYRRRRLRDSAGDGDTGGFPCWLACDASGIRALAWEAVRLVELVTVETTQTDRQDRHHSKGAICVSMIDGSEHEFDAVTLTMDDASLVTDADYLLRIRAMIDTLPGTVPP
jgi:hypothetical protein